MKGSCAKLIPQKCCGSEKGFTNCRSHHYCFSIAQESGEKLALLCFTNRGCIINPFRRDGSNLVKRMHPMVLGVHLCMNCLRQEVLQQKTMSNLSFPSPDLDTQSTRTGTVLFTQDQEKSNTANTHMQIHENRGH